jgi:hypothetical protein
VICASHDTYFLQLPGQFEDKPVFGIADETDDFLRLAGDLLSQLTQNFTRKI